LQNSLQFGDRGYQFTDRFLNDGGIVTYLCSGDGESSASEISFQGSALKRVN
jgi:hypothetical protein